MIAGVFFSFWRILQIITLIPTLGMLVCSGAYCETDGLVILILLQAYFVDQFQDQNRLTPDYILCVVSSVC